MIRGHQQRTGVYKYSFVKNVKVCLSVVSRHAYVSQPKTTSPRQTNIYIERFSIECRKTKTKVITLANHKGHR